MQYMLMCGFDETRWEKMPDAQKSSIMQEYGEFVQGIVKSGHYRAGGVVEVRPVVPTYER